MIVVHCTDSSWGTVEAVDQWHKERGWSGIGYHALVYNGRTAPRECNPDLDGAIFPGRPEEEIGAHAYGYNKYSLGICYVGGPSSPCTDAQWGSLIAKVAEWCAQYGVPWQSVRGHAELDPAKSCPCLDMDAFRSAVRDALENT